MRSTVWGCWRYFILFCDWISAISSLECFFHNAILDISKSKCGDYKIRHHTNMVSHYWNRQAGRSAIWRIELLMIPVLTSQRSEHITVKHYNGSKQNLQTFSWSSVRLSPHLQAFSTAVTPTFQLRKADLCGRVKASGLTTAPLCRVLKYAAPLASSRQTASRRLDLSPKLRRNPTAGQETQHSSRTAINRGLSVLYISGNQPP